MSLFDSASIVVTPNAYKASKLYAIKPTDGSGDLSVVRATTATRVNSSGLIESVATNVPRLDYTNSTCPSILVEPQRTNVTQRSEEFDNGYWVKTNSDIISNTTIAPDGNLTADTFSDRVLTNQTYTIRRNQSYTSGTTYTSSFFAKNLNRRYVYMRFVSSVFGTNKYAFFDLQLGTVISADSGVTAQIIDYGNGWFRCIATSTASVTTTSVSGILIGLSDNGVGIAYTNPSVKSIYLWGAQLEAGSNATSYIPTAFASVTRNADNIDLLNSGILPTAYPFTILTKAKYSLKEQYFVLSFLDTTSGSSYFSLRFLSNKINALIRPNITEILVTSTSNFNEGDLVNIVLKVTSSQIKLFVNGQIEATATNTLSFNTSINDLMLGRLRVVSDTNTRIGNDLVSIWNQELTDQECINLTTI